MKDSLGDRMKDQYENRTRYLLPRRTYTIIRVDGKAFHSFTRKMTRPFDTDMMRMMDVTAQTMVKETQGACFAFVQSDEISLLLTDFATEQTDAWFDGNVQKMCSISAALATMAFNSALLHSPYRERKPAMFDSRVFTIPDPIEVENYFIWRQQDATRNSIQMAAQALYSHKELHGKKLEALQEMIFQKGINWNDYTAREKRGGFFTRTETMECPIFTQDRDFLRSRIPRLFESHAETPERIKETERASFRTT